jgi:hypothetical protein
MMPALLGVIAYGALVLAAVIFMMNRGGGD